MLNKRLFPLLCCLTGCVASFTSPPSPTGMPSVTPTINLVSVNQSPLPTTTPIAVSSSPLVSLPFKSDVDYGVSYSYPQARWLFDGTGRDAKDVLQTLANMNIKNFRLEAYWNWVEDTKGILKTSYNIDWQLEVMQKANAKKVVMCIGRKVPHWPEYHIPTWAKAFNEINLKEALLSYEGRFVDVYANDTRITHWQVENEPYFEFGEGAPFADQKDFLKKEIDIIRTHDALKRPIIITGSGDKGDWKNDSEFSDIFGVSFYGISYESGIYVNHENGKPSDWQDKAKSLSVPTWMIEMQAEPWGPQSVKDLSYEEALKSMNVNRVVDHLNFVNSAGFTVVFLWGGEWMVWLKDRGHSELLDTLKVAFK